MTDPTAAPLRTEEGRRTPHPALTETRRDALICLSFANFCFIRVWYEMLSYRRIDEVWMKTIPTPTDYGSVMTAVLLLAVVLYGAVRMARRYLSGRGVQVVRFASFGLVAIPLNGLRAALSRFSIYLKSPLLGLIGPRTIVFLILPVTMVVLWLLWRHQRLVGVVAAEILIVLSPVCLLTFGQAVAAMLRYPGQPYHDGPLAPRLSTRNPTTRVVWIIFDEWDYRLTFPERPADLAMPEIDRLRAESLFANAARSPGTDTAVSVPALISGGRVQTSSESARRGIAIEADRPQDSGPVQLEERSSIFYAVRKQGFDVGLVGWYLPYCRMVNRVLSECDWEVLPIQANSAEYSFLAGSLGTGFWGRVAGYSVGLLETDSLSVFGQSSSTRHKVRQYVDLLGESKKDVTDSRLGLVFLHLPVPHAPHAYNRFTRQLDGSNRPISGYVDSLGLLDRMLGEIRAAMEAHGDWNHTVLLVSSDHPFRASQALDGKSDSRVPFLIHFPGQQSGGVLDFPFDTIVSASLVHSILRGEISTPAAAAEWIGQHRGDRELPVAVAGQ